MNEPRSRLPFVGQSSLVLPMSLVRCANPLAICSSVAGLAGGSEPLENRRADGSVHGRDSSD